MPLLRPIRTGVVAAAAGIGTADAERGPAHVDDRRVVGADVVDLETETTPGVRRGGWS